MSQFVITRHRHYWSPPEYIVRRDDGQAGGAQAVLRAECRQFGWVRVDARAVGGGGVEPFSLRARDMLALHYDVVTPEGRRVGSLLCDLEFPRSWRVTDGRSGVTAQLFGDAVYLRAGGGPAAGGPVVGELWGGEAWLGLRLHGEGVLDTRLLLGLGMVLLVPSGDGGGSAG